MDNTERAALLKLYADRVAEMGDDVRSLGWKNREDQRLRFQILADIGDLSGSVVCDVGCGFGDLLPYLEERCGSIDYFGTDISAEVLTVARQRHPEARFLLTDILAHEYTERADWFLLSGALSFKIADNLAFTQSMLAKMLDRSRRGVAANFLSTYVNYQHPRNYHYDPTDIFRMAKQLTPRVTIRHDYPLWEFTAYLYK